MSDLNSIVDLNISLATFTPSRPSFDVPIILNFHTRFAEMVRTYNSIAELEADGFVSGDPVHAVASKIKSQNPSPRQFKVGRLTGTQTARVVRLVPVVLNATAYGVIVNGVAFTFTSDADATAAEIVAGLLAAINAGDEPVTASNSTDRLVITGDVAGVDFTVGVSNPALWSSINDTSDARTTLGSSMSAIETEDPNWYAVLTTRNNAAEIATLAGLVLSREKLLFANALNYGSDVAAEDNLGNVETNLIGVLSGASNNRVIPLFTKQDNEHPAAALAGALLWRTPGSYTAMFRNLAGVTPSALTATDVQRLEARNCNHYTSVANNSIVRQGVTSAGSPWFADTVIFLDWQRQRIQQRIFAALNFADKIPFTDGGVEIIANAIEAALAEGVANGGIAPDSIVVTAPLVAELDPADVADRNLNLVRFEFRLAGAIHKVRPIRGSVSPS